MLIIPVKLIFPIVGYLEKLAGVDVWFSIKSVITNNNESISHFI